MTDDVNNSKNRDARVRGVSWTTRRILLGVLAAVLVVLALWLIAAWRDDGPSEQSGKEMSEMEGMAGMEGMDVSADGSVQLTASQITEFGVTFGTADVRTLENKIRTTGVVNFDETRIAQVTLKFSGFVEQLHVDFTGQPVRRGQPLLEIYSPELVAAQEELLVAARLERTMDETAVPGVPIGSSNLLAAATRRLRLWDISDAQIQQILAKGEVQRTLTIHAPSSGIVIEKNVVVGQAVQMGHTLYTIVDLSVVWVEAELRENEAGSVREGTRATLEFAAFPGRPYTGRVQYVYPTVQEASRTIKARVAVENPGARMKPGMYATVRFTTPSRAVLSVPAAAIIRTGERAVVFVDMGDGRLMPHEIETGSVGDEFVEVLTGLEPGQRVVTSAQFLLDSESNLGEVMKAMMAMENRQ